MMPDQTRHLAARPPHDHPSWELPSTFHCAVCGRAIYTEWTGYMYHEYDDPEDARRMMRADPHAIVVGARRDEIA